MTVARSSCDSKGDAGGDSVATGLSERRRGPSECPPPLAAAPQGQSRFWALAGESSDEEEEDVALQEVPESPVPSRSDPTPACLGDFLDPAWTRVGSARRRGGRRRAWAPGGRGSLFRAAAGAGAARLLGSRGGPEVAKDSLIQSRPVGISSVAPGAAALTSASAGEVRAAPPGSPVNGEGGEGPLVASVAGPRQVGLHVPTSSASGVGALRGPTDASLL
jgi:hypothetical protein